jgi:glycosyltransferase involved in cell wall biosynthesis
MISVVIPAHNAAVSLPALFQSLFGAAMDGLVSEVIVSDCGSTDATREIADAAGATVIEAGCGQELLAGAQAARKPWLLFLHADAVLENGWAEEVITFIGKGEGRAAAFRVRLAPKGKSSRAREVLLRIKASALGLPICCPALLIPAKLLNAMGAFASTPPFDEADLVRRLGRKRVARLDATVVVAALAA